jgi:hypothetical protein
MQGRTTTTWTHEMAAAAVEKPATFSRDTSNSSRNSQLGMANRYFDIKPLSFRFFITQSLSNWFVSFDIDDITKVWSFCWS